eukprot:Pgem_evm1s18222
MVPKQWKHAMSKTKNLGGWDAVFQITQLGKQALNDPKKRQIFTLLLIDIKKAFDKLSHKGLLKKLDRYNYTELP